MFLANLCKFLYRLFPAMVWTHVASHPLTKKIVRFKATHNRIQIWLKDRVILST